MVDLIDVLENELKRQNVSNPRELARKQAVALSCFLGGRQFYIPCGDTILTALRDDLLYCQFNGRNMEELRRPVPPVPAADLPDYCPPEKAGIHDVISLICSHLKPQNNRHPAGYFVTIIPHLPPDFLDCHQSIFSGKHDGGDTKKLKAALLAVTIAGGGVGGYQEMTRQSLIHLENIAYMPYRDIAGVLTVCVGHTGPDIEMRRYSHAECMALLDSDLKPVYAAIDRLVRVPLTPYQKTALATFIFNTGVTAFSKSTLLKKLNAGDYAGARDQMARWVFAAGHKWKGLMNRREVEMAIWNIRGADDLRQ